MCSLDKCLNGDKDQDYHYRDNRPVLVFLMLVTFKYLMYGNRMQVDDELLQKQHQNRNARATPESECKDEGNTRCRTQLICRLRTASFDQYQDCLESGPPSLPSPTDQTPMPTASGGRTSALVTSLPVLAMAAMLSKMCA